MRVGIDSIVERLVAVRGDHDMIVGRLLLPWLSWTTTPCGVRSIEVTAQPSRS